jgi:hypothetical protein
MNKLLFLDTEFNGHGGSLISLALVPADSAKPWYGVLAIPDRPHVFVAEHVIPKLERDAMGAEIFNASLSDYLLRYYDATVIADWPADFEHLCNQLTYRGREVGWALPVLLTMKLINTPALNPVNPHNALSDAQALRDWYVAHDFQ